MEAFVLDASVAVFWCFPGDSSEDTGYSRDILALLLLRICRSLRRENREKPLPDGHGSVSMMERNHTLMSRDHEVAVDGHALHIDAAADGDLKRAAGLEGIEVVSRRVA